MFMDDIKNRIEIVRICILEIAADIFNNTLRKIPCKAPFIIRFIGILTTTKTPCEYLD
jgi:hypothetical protein